LYFFYLYSVWWNSLIAKFQRFSTEVWKKVKIKFFFGNFPHFLKFWRKNYYPVKIHLVWIFKIAYSEFLIFKFLIVPREIWIEFRNFRGCPTKTVEKIDKNSYVKNFETHIFHQSTQGQEPCRHQFFAFFEWSLETNKK
jgi:hypothetical protein